MSIQSVKPSRLLKGATRRIQGINSDVDDVKLLGESFKAVVSNAIVEPGIELARTIEGASTITIPIEDPEGRLRRSKLMQARFELELDDLWFRWVAAGRQGKTFTLTTESREVSDLRRKRGPKKKYRDKMTRAEFAAWLVRDANPRIPFFSPKLHKVQPIATDRQAREDKAERGARRDKGIEPSGGGGLDRSARLTAKGAPADAEQIRNGDTILRVGESVGAPRNALIAGITTGITESLLRNNPNMIDATSTGVFQVQTATAQSVGVNPMDVADCAEAFYTKGFWKQSAIKSAAWPADPHDLPERAGLGGPERGELRGVGFRGDQVGRRVRRWRPVRI